MKILLQGIVMLVFISTEGPKLYYILGSDCPDALVSAIFTALLIVLTAFPSSSTILFVLALFWNLLSRPQYHVLAVTCFLWRPVQWTQDCMSAMAQFGVFCIYIS